MIQVRLGGNLPSYPTAPTAPTTHSPWHAISALARVARGAVAVSLRHLLQSGADDTAPTQRLRSSLGTGANAGASARQQGHFEQWFARYQPPLLDYLYGMTRGREWAADLVQETFLHAYRAAGRDPASIEHPQAWLYRIATNTALSALRRTRRFGWLPLSAVEPEAGARSSDRWQRPEPEIEALRGPDVAATVAERDAVWAVLAELPPRWRAVLLLQTTAGFEVREIAAELGISEANTRKILFRAKERFRQITARLAEAEAKGGAR
ncbi:MAG TPA: sigma-70 family RNA polymerase sigma factor [Ktedonobacterales bacterium]